MIEGEAKVTPNGANALGIPLAGYAKIRATSEAMTEAQREICSSSARCATGYGLKEFEISDANAAPSLDLFVHLIGSKSPADVFALSAAQARKAFDAASNQNKKLWSLPRSLRRKRASTIRKRITGVLHQGRQKSRSSHVQGSFEEGSGRLE